MIRLTFSEENGKFGVAGMNESNQDEKLYACVKKLKDYEDLGLNPDEIYWKLNKLKAKDERLKEENARWQEEHKRINLAGAKKVENLQQQLKFNTHQVCEKIRERYNLEGKPITDAFCDTQYGYVMVSAKDLSKFLDEIEKGANT